MFGRWLPTPVLAMSPETTGVNGTPLRRTMIACACHPPSTPLASAFAFCIKGRPRRKTRGFQQRRCIRIRFAVLDDGSVHLREVGKIAISDGPKGSTFSERLSTAMVDIRYTDCFKSVRIGGNPGLSWLDRY